MLRPQTTVILAMSADGKIADTERNAARFSSKQDLEHLEEQISLVDGVVFGAATLRVYQTALPVKTAQLVEMRLARGQSAQPVQIVCTGSGRLERSWQFFKQDIPHWAITTEEGLSQLPVELFEQVIVARKSLSESKIDWLSVMPKLWNLGIKSLGVLGGGELVASLIELDLVDEFWLTVCPVILGGKNSPTPVDGANSLQKTGQKLQLLSVKEVAGEVFLHYRVLMDKLYS